MVTSDLHDEAEIYINPIFDVHLSKASTDTIVALYTGKNRRQARDCSIPKSRDIMMR